MIPVQKFMVKFWQMNAKAGTPIGSNDIQIASIAIANNLILVTHPGG